MQEEEQAQEVVERMPQIHDFAQVEICYAHDRQLEYADRSQTPALVHQEKMASLVATAGRLQGQRILTTLAALPCNCLPMS